LRHIHAGEVINLPDWLYSRTGLPTRVVSQGYVSDERGKAEAWWTCARIVSSRRCILTARRVYRSTIGRAQVYVNLQDQNVPGRDLIRL